MRSDRAVRHASPGSRTGRPRIDTRRDFFDAMARPAGRVGSGEPSELRQPLRQEPPLRLLLGQRQGPLVGRAGVVRAGPAGGAGRPGRRGRGGSRRGRRGRGWRRSSPSPAAGPSRIATATARFNSTTGDGFTASSASYSAAICRQSVAAAVGAPAWTAAMAAWSVYGPTCRLPSARPTSARPSAISRGVPRRAVLVFEQHEVAVRRSPGRGGATPGGASARAGRRPPGRAAVRPPAGPGGSPRPTGRPA